MQSINVFFKEEDDFLYQRGAKNAAKKMNNKYVKSLILESDLSDERIAHIVKVDVDFVKNLRTELNNK